MTVNGARNAVRHSKRVTIATPPWRSGSERGDTLIEVLLALIVLALASVALMLAFSTSITASSTHRNLTAANVALEAVEQEAQSAISSNVGLFSCPATLATFVQDVSLPTPNDSPAFTGAITSVEWWNGQAFTTSCVSGAAVQVTVSVTGAGKTYVATFVVEYPLGTSSANGGVGTVPTQLVFIRAPSSSTTFTSGLPFDSADQPIVEVEDAKGDPVVNDTSPVILSLVDASQATLGSCSGPETNGVVDFSGCTVTLNNGVSSANGLSLQTSDSSLSTTVYYPSNSTFTVSTSTSLPTLTFLSQPSANASGNCMKPDAQSTPCPANTQFQIAVQQNGTTMRSWTGTISLAINGASSTSPQLQNCVISGPTAGVFSVSKCTFQGSINDTNGTSATSYTMTATATPSGSWPAVLPATSNSITVTGPGTPVQLLFVSQPIGGYGSLPVAVNPAGFTVEVIDSWGNVAYDQSGTVSLASATSGETLTNCPSATMSNGFANFPASSTQCTMGAYASGVQVTATYTTLSQKSSFFDVTGAPASLQFTTQPQAGPSGSVMVVQPQISILDSHGYVVTADTNSITSPTVSPVDAGVPQPQLTGCTDFAPNMGVIQVGTCAFVGVEGTSYTMTTTLGSITSSPSASFTPSGPGAPAKLVFATNPVAGASGSAFTTQPVILVEDVAGNLTNASNVSVSLSASGGSLTGCSNLSSVAGVVSVSNCQFGGVVGQSYTLTATSTGLSSGVSGTFTPTSAGAPAQVAVTSFPSGSVKAGSSLSGVAFSIEDSFGNVVSTGPGSNDVLSVSLGANPGNVSLQPGPNAILTAVAGVVTLSGESLNTAGTYTITATDSSETLPITSTVVSAPLTVVAAAPTQMSFTIQPGGGTGGVVWPVQPALTLKDPYGNVALADASTVTLSIASGPTGAVLSGCTQSESAGVVTFHGCSINKAGAYTLLATDSSGGVATTTSQAFSVSIGGATQLVFTQEPAGTVTEGTALTTQPIVQIEDAGGNVVTTDASTITFSVASYSAGTSGGSAQGSVTGCTPLETNGVFTFTNCQITGVGAAGTYTIKATDSAGGVATATSTPAFSVIAGSASKLAYNVAPPLTATAGTALTTFKVAVEDANGNVITTGTGSTDNVTLSVATGPGTFNSASTTYTNVPAVGGIATFSGIVLNTSGAYTFTASDMTHAGYTPVTSVSQTVVGSSVGSKVVYNVEPPATGTAGAALTTFLVYVEDQYGNLVTTNTGSTDVITLTPSTGTINSGATATAVGGVATFSSTTINAVGSYTFTASDTSHGGYTTAVSTPATVISAAGASKLVYNVQPPATGTAGTALTTFKVYVEDPFGNLITTGTGSTDTITLAPSSGSITSGSSVVAVGGVATFSSTTLNTSGSYTFTASDTTHPAYTTATSTPATVIGSSVGAKLVYNVEPPSAGTAGTALTTFRVYVEDQYGNLVTTGTGSTDVITLTPSSGTINGGATATAVGGVATFSSTTINAVGSYTFTANDTTHGSYNPATSTPATVIGSNVGSKLVYNVEPPAAGTAGVALTTFKVYVEDAYGNLVTTNTGSTDTITLLPSTGSIASGGSIAAVGGVATFSATKINIAGSYTFTASDTTNGALTTAVSTPATVISPAGASKLGYNVTPPATGVAGTALTTFSVAVEDQYGNVITSGTGSTDTITLSVATGPAGFSSASTTYTNVPAVGGVATFSGITVNTSGSYTFTATDTTHGGYTPTTSASATVVGSNVGTKLVYNVEPPATGTAGTALTTFRVYVEDQYGNLVTSNTGASDTISLAPSTGTINAGASVAAVGGIATFSGTTINTVGSYTFTASDTTNGALTTAVSTPATAISPAAASQLVYNVQPPATGTAGTALTTFKVYVEDQYGNLVTTNTGATDVITLTPSTGTINGGASATAVGGVATFSGTTVNTVGSYTFTAGDTTNGALTTATSTPATVISRAGALQLLFNVQPPATGTAGTALTTFKVYVTDAYGNLITTGTGSNDSITLTPTGPGVIASGASATAAGGVATFSSTILDTSGSYTFTASDSTHSGYTVATSTPPTVIATAGASKVVYSVQPPLTGTAGNVLSTFNVAVEDTYGNIITTGTGSTDNITLSLATKPAGGAFSSASATYTNVTAVGGVATFSAVAVSGAGSYTFTATDSSRVLTTATSTPATTVFASHLYTNSGTGGTVTTPSTSTARLDPVLVIVSYYASSRSAPACATPTGYGTTFTATPTPIQAATNYYNSGGGGYATYFGYCAYTAQIATGATLGAYNVNETLGITGGASTDNVEVQVIEMSGDTAATFPNDGPNSGTSATPAFNLGSYTLGDQEIVFGTDATNTGAGPATWTLPSGFNSVPTANVGTGATGFNVTVGIGTATGAINGGLSTSSNWAAYAVDLKP